MRGLAYMAAVVWLLWPAAADGADLTHAEGVVSYCERVSPEPPGEVVRSWASPCSPSSGSVLGDTAGAGDDSGASSEALEAAFAVVGLAVEGSAGLLCRVVEPEAERELLGEWIRERHGWLLATHHLDVAEPVLEMHEDLGLVVAHHAAVIEAGGGESRLFVGGEGRIAFEPAQSLQDEVQRLHWLGDLVLRLEVVARSVEEPAMAGGRAYCTRREEEGGWDVHGRVVGAVLVDGTTGEELVRVGGLSRLSGVPVAGVTALDVEGGQACPPRESGLIRLAVEGVANRCYAESLLASGLVRGAVVVGMDVTAEGRTDGVRVLIDVLQHPPLTACLVTELSRTRLPRLEGGEEIRVRVALTFSMEAEDSGGDPSLASPTAEE